MLFLTVLLAGISIGSCKGDKLDEDIPDFVIGKDPVDPGNENEGNDEPGKDDDTGPKSMPVVRVSTENAAPITSKEDYVKGTVSISDPDCKYSETKLLESPMKIRGRGNTTWKYDKKPYRIKMDEKQKVLGMDKNKDWVLLANYCDKSLIRNLVAMEISRKLEFSWTIDIIPVEFYLNGEYQGVYCMCQHKEVANHRVDIAEDDLFFELDKNMDEPVHFRSAVCKIPVNFSHPEQR